MSKTSTAKNLAVRPRQETDLPLEKTEVVETDPVTKASVKIQRFTRGVLSLEQRTYDRVSPGFNSTYSSSREMFEKRREYLRDRLESLGLPSDRQWSWTRTADGKWTQIESVKGALEAGYQNVALWTYVVENLTEPLSEGKYLADELFYLNQLLSEELSETVLYSIGQLIRTESQLRILGPINRLATAGLKARKLRARGPAARKDHSKQKKEVVWRLTPLLWQEKPLLRGDASNSAAHLVERVEAELQKLGVTPPKVAAKTIGDYIREGQQKRIF